MKDRSINGQVVVRLRFRPTEWGRLIDAADASGISPTQWAKQQVVAALAASGDTADATTIGGSNAIVPGAAQTARGRAQTPRPRRS